jgi:antitoxin component of RelBE/YafQ-DinJ toxin-antitoxin module
MEQQQISESVRIDKDLLDKIRMISKQRGQTISGFINISLAKIVERHWHKFQTNDKKNHI